MSHMLVNNRYLIFILYRLKINLFTPIRQLSESKLILTSSSSSPDFLGIVGSSLSASYVTLQNYGNKIINSFKLKPPFLFQGGKDFLLLPPPAGGEGWEGGSLIKKITLKAQIRNSLNCYINSEEIHSYQTFVIFV